MQRIVNYGSFLQAYALKKIIEQIGDNQVQFVDYTYEPPINDIQESRIKCWRRRLAFNYLPGKIFSKKCAYRLKKDLKKIGVDQINRNADVDTLVIGSDEVFNCMQGYPVGYSRELFGKNYENIKVISYAASFGHTTIVDLKKNHIEKDLGEMLSKFAAISVRDQNSYEIVEKLTDKNIYRHLDPVLLYDFKEGSVLQRSDKQPYIIVYAYTNRLSKREEKYIKTFARTRKMKIYSVGNYNRIADKNIICSPMEVFSIFKNAEYIITDTFHGTIFSIKMNMKFCTIIRDSNKNKLEALLRTLNRLDRVVVALEDIEKLYQMEIDYTMTNEIIKKEKKKTETYLLDNL